MGEFLGLGGPKWPFRPPKNPKLIGFPQDLGSKVRNSGQIVVLQAFFTIFLIKMAKNQGFFTISLQKT